MFCQSRVVAHDSINSNGHSHRRIISVYASKMFQTCSCNISLQIQCPGDSVWCNIQTDLSRESNNPETLLPKPWLSAVTHQLDPGPYVHRARAETSQQHAQSLSAFDAEQGRH